MSSLERYIVKTFMYLKITRCIWKDLEGRFETPSSSYMFRLLEKLLNNTQESGTTIVDFFTKVKSLRDEIDDLGPLPFCNCHPTTNFVKIQQD